MLVGLIAVSAGCGRCGRLDGLADPDVLYVGDSILGWNERSCRSIPAATAMARGVGYESAAVNGARMLSGDAPIPTQSIDGDWRVVVIDGGANDLNGCGCGEGCAEVMDRLVSADGGEGVIPDLVESWLDRGSEVVVLGYYPVPDSAWYGFDRCFASISELDRRVAALASQREGVTFFDFGDVMGPGVPRLYAFDDAHPSPRGARMIGAALAERIP